MVELSQRPASNQRFSGKEATECDPKTSNQKKCVYVFICTCEQNKTNKKASK